MSESFPPVWFGPTEVRLLQLIIKICSGPISDREFEEAMSCLKAIVEVVLSPEADPPCAAQVH